MPQTRACPEFSGNQHGDRFIHHRHGQHHAFGLFDQGTSIVAKRLDIFINLLRDTAAQHSFRTQYTIEIRALFLQALEFALNLDAFHLRKLAQTDFQNIFGLTIRQFEARDQCRLRIVRLAYQRDHFIQIQEHDHPAFQHVNTIVDLR